MGANLRLIRDDKESDNDVNVRLTSESIDVHIQVLKMRSIAVTRQ